ncbi:MAG TPA: 1,2-phenylacetyl-CoA epoxidase subunit PaaC [Phycisphaerales bacterium]|nr:1,2-phenylacetyl-CoA epoxidase subunit PaaC [Phycisphaerales bacterium]
MNTTAPQLQNALVQLLFALADDKLLLGHRNSDWTGLGPILEEDIAFSHLAQDEIAHAQAIYEFIASMTAGNADDLAFNRTPAQFRSAHIVEVPDEFDWATAMARKFFCDHFDLLRLNRLAKSSNPDLAALASRIASEETLHVEHVDQWIVRLGRSTPEARKRLQRALDALAPLAVALWEPVENEQQLVTANLYPQSTDLSFESWAAKLQHVMKTANLKLTLPPRASALKSKAGRAGVHTSHLAPLLNEMCEVRRADPGAKW